MPTPTPQSERRRAQRALASFPVRFTSQADGRPAGGKQATSEPAVLRDISEIGLACSAPQEIPEMTLVGLDFSLPGAADVHHVKGAVVRCEAMPHGKAQPKGKVSYDLAVYFTEISPITRAALKNYVGKAKKAP